MAEGELQLKKRCGASLLCHGAELRCVQEMEDKQEELAAAEAAAEQAAAGRGRTSPQAHKRAQQARPPAPSSSHTSVCPALGTV